MEISIFGLGYVGCVSAACLAELGHEIIGVDVDEGKVEKINQGVSPVVEKGLDDFTRRAVEKGRLQAVTDAREAVARTSVSMICVGTPSRENGSLNLDMVKKVCGEIGTAMTARKPYHLVVIRSTILPGTVSNLLLPIIANASGRRPEEGFGICANPEFLREGSSIQDFYNPPMIVIGERAKKDGDTVESIYEGVNAPVVRTSIETSEMVKYVSNVFHALKIGFANEIGRICKELGIDSHELMKVFCMDKKLNVSEAYLKPGFAFGGSCLPKDLRALLYRCKELDLPAPILEGILPSNETQKAGAFDMIRRTGRKKIGFLGLSFKAGTDDLRESATVEVIEMLIGKGFEVSIYDKEVAISRLIGANKKYIEDKIPHVSRLMKATGEQVVYESEVVVIAKGSDEFSRLLEGALGKGKIVVDLVRCGDARSDGTGYLGIAW